MATLYGYARCSTNETKQDIDRQKRELRSEGVSSNNIFWEYAHGTKDDRIELNRLMSTAKPGDSIIVTEISRLARSTQKLCAILDDVQTNQLRLVVCGSITFDCTPGHEGDVMTKGMIKMWGVFAELEGDIIRQRIKSGMDNARAKGAEIGRPATTKDSIPAKFYKYYPEYKSGARTVTEMARLAGIAVEYVNPAYTSQTCPHCGRRHKADDRHFVCTCGYHIHRDILGAMNIMRSTEPVGGSNARQAA